MRAVFYGGADDTGFSGHIEIWSCVHRHAQTEVSHSAVAIHIVILPCGPRETHDLLPRSAGGTHFRTG